MCKIYSKSVMEKTDAEDDLLQSLRDKFSSEYSKIVSEVASGSGCHPKAEVAPVPTPAPSKIDRRNMPTAKLKGTNAAPPSHKPKTTAN